MKKAFLHSFIPAGLALLLTACGGGGGGGSAAPEATYLSVTSTNPANHAADVPVNAAITAAFSEAVAQNTLSTATFLISDGVTGTVTYDSVNHVATFTPSTDLAYGTTYTATITTGVLSFAERRLAADYAWSFTTGSAPDTTPPTVSSTVPAGGSTGAAINAAITATFSEALKGSTITTASFLLKDEADNPVNGTVSYNGTTAVFTPSTDLAYDTTYTATITTGVQDLAGNAPASHHAWTFTTGGAPDTTPPAVSSVSPAHAAVDVPVTAAIGADFSEPMNASTLTTNNFMVRDSRSFGIAGSVAYSGTTATFTPASNLASAVTYTATITTAARDLAGNGLASNHTWTFRTAPSVAPRYAYTVNPGENTLWAYLVHAADGQLEYLGKTDTGAWPTAVAVDRAGKYAYVTNWSDSTVSQYTIAPDGTLASMTTSSVGSGLNPISLLVDPSDRFVYTVNNGGNGSVSQYSIGTDGGLTHLGEKTLAAGSMSGPSAIAIDPSGKNVYLTNRLTHTIEQFSIGSDGLLTHLTPSTVAVGAGITTPVSIAVDPLGTHAYVLRYSDNLLSQYAIGPDGALTHVGGGDLYVGSHSVFITTDPAGRNAYFVTQGTNASYVKQRTIGPDGLISATGQVALSDVTTTSVTVDPSGRYLYEANGGSGTIGQCSINADGTFMVNSPASVPIPGGPSRIVVTSVSLLQ